MNISLILIRILISIPCIFAGDLTATRLESLFDVLYNHGHAKMVLMYLENLSSQIACGSGSNEVLAAPQKLICDIVFELYAFRAKVKDMLHLALRRKNIYYKKHVVVALMEVHADYIVCPMLDHMYKYDTVDVQSSFYLSYMFKRLLGVEHNLDAMMDMVRTNFHEIHNDLRVILIDIDRNQDLDGIEELACIVRDINSEDMSKFMCEELMFFVDYILYVYERHYMPVFKKCKITDTEIDIAVRKGYSQILRCIDAESLYRYTCSRLEAGGSCFYLLSAMQILYEVLDTDQLEKFDLLVPAEVEEYTDLDSCDEVRAFLMKHKECVTEQNIIEEFVSARSLDMLAVFGNVHRDIYGDSLVLPKDISSLILRDMGGSDSKGEIQDSGVKFNMPTLFALRYKDDLAAHFAETNLILDLQDPRIIELIFEKYRKLFSKVDDESKRQDLIDRIFMHPACALKYEYGEYLLSRGFKERLFNFIKKAF